MKMKSLIVICLVLFIVSIAGVSATDDVNQTVDDTLSLSHDCENLGIDEIDGGAVVNSNSTLMDNSPELLMVDDDTEDIGISSYNESVNDGTFEDIQNLIDDAVSGDVIVLDGYYSGTGSSISVHKPVTIIGADDTVLDAKGLSSILTVTADDVCIENIKFINGQDYWGGAIDWSGDSGVLMNSVFLNNSANWGGAIFWWASDGYLSDCLFVNNTAQNYGGALYVNGRNLRMLSSVYINNVVTNSISSWQGGGAIYTDLTPDTAEDCHIVANSTFISNKAINSWGGALKLGSGSAIFDSNEFYDNFALRGTSIMLGDVKKTINNRFYLNSIDEISSCAEEGNLSTIFDLNTFFVNGHIVSKNSYFNNETNSNTFLTAGVVVDYNNGGSRLVISLNDIEDNPIVGADVFVVLGNAGYSLVTGSDGQASVSTSDLAPGQYTAVIFYEGNNMYNPASTTLNFSVDKIDTILTVPDVVVVGNSTGVVFATLKDSYGNIVSGVNVKIVVGSLSKTAKTNKKGRVYLDISGLAPGMYTISARSSATSTIYKESRTTAKAIVSADKIDTTLTVPDVIVLGNSPAGVVATLKDSYGNAVSGVNVKIVVGDLSIIDATDKNGKVSLDISGLEPGEYKVSARSSRQTDIYNEARAYAKAIVSADKIDTTLTVPDVVVVGNSTGVVVATLKDSYGNVVSGVNVKIVVGDLSKTAKTNKNGQVSLDISGLAPGVYTISARSSATSAIYKESRITAKAIVSADKIGTTLTVPDVVVVGNSTGVVVATLKDSYGNVVSGVNVKIVVGSLSKTAKTNKNGQVSLDISPLAPGVYTISARSSATSVIYKESRTTAKATVSADKIGTKLTVPDVVVVGNSTGVVVATLKDSYGNAVSGVNVKIVVGNLSKTAKTNKNGRVSLDISDLAPGEYKVSARSSATSAIYKESRTTAKAIVKGKVASQLTADDLGIAYGENATLVVTLEDIDGNAIGNAILYAFTTYNETYVFITDDEGKAYLSINNLELGSYSVYINFEGNDFYLESNAAVNILVNKAYSKWDLNGFDQFYYGEQGCLSSTLKDINGNPIANVTTTVTFVKAYTSEDYVSYTLVTNNEGIININTKDLSVNDYFVNYNFAGNSYYEPSSGYHSISVIKCPTHFIMDNSFDSANYQDNKWWSVKLIKYYDIFDFTGDGIGNADVKITFTEKSTQRQYVFDLKTSSNSQDYGYAKLNTKDMLPGVYSITVDYLGDNNYAETHRYYDYYSQRFDDLTFTINKANPTITTTGVTTKYGTEGFVTATLKDPNGNVMANRLVTFTFEDGTGSTVRTDKNGKAQLSTLGIATGTHAISVTYVPESGSDDYYRYNNVSSSVTMKINKADAVLSAKSSTAWIYRNGQQENTFYISNKKEKEIQIYLKDQNGNLLVGKSIKFSGHTSSYSSSGKTDSQGIVTFKLKYNYMFPNINPEVKYFSETFTLNDDCYTATITVKVGVTTN